MYCTDSFLVAEVFILPVAGTFVDWSQLGSMTNLWGDQRPGPIASVGTSLKTVLAPELPQGGWLLPLLQLHCPSLSAPSCFVHPLIGALLLRVVPNKLPLRKSVSKSLSRAPNPGQCDLQNAESLPIDLPEMSNTNVNHSCIHTYFLFIEDLLHVKYCVSFSEFSEMRLF